MRKSLISLLPFLTACAGEPPSNIGVRDGRLSPCPDSPNCVSSFAADQAHFIEPLSADIDRIRQALLDLNEANIVSESENYLYAEFTSRIMGFVDDVEFLRDSSAGLTHVRSASRLGYSDLGVNRKRIDNIRSLTR